MRGNPAFRKAVAASIGVHLLIAVGIVGLYRWHAMPPPATAALDTRVMVHLEFPEADAGPAAAVTIPIPEMVAPVPAPAVPVPAALPAEIAPVRPARPAGPVENPGPVQAAAAVVATPAPPVKPAGRAEPARAAGGTPVHGPLQPKQAIVYVLDASGSMGEWGKFDTARRALIATLRLQPETVRFQIVIYSDAANAVLRGAPGECLPAVPRNIARTIAALDALPAPAGRSNHAEGLRTALALHPDLVLLFTDADDLPAAALRGVRRQAERPAILCVARVAAAGVGEPVEWK